jgi:hypothetical protein
VGFGAFGDVVLWFHSEYRLTRFIEDVGFLLCVSCASLLIGVTPLFSVRKGFIYDNSFLGLN